MWLSFRGVILVLNPKRSWNKWSDKNSSAKWASASSWQRKGAWVRFRGARPKKHTATKGETADKTNKRKRRTWRGARGQEVSGGAPGPEMFVSTCERVKGANTAEWRRRYSISAETKNAGQRRAILQMKLAPDILRQAQMSDRSRLNWAEQSTKKQKKEESFPRWCSLGFHPPGVNLEPERAAATSPGPTKWPDTVPTGSADASPPAKSRWSALGGRNERDVETIMVMWAQSARNVSIAENTSLLHEVAWG